MSGVCNGLLGTQCSSLAIGHLDLALGLPWVRDELCPKLSPKQSYYYWTADYQH
jgi:hypothetical protein